jgi:Flp pilus assembly pilin Flp
MRSSSPLPAGFLREQRGAALIEYALLLMLISIVCLLAITALGARPAQNFSTVGNSMAVAGQ